MLDLFNIGIVVTIFSLLYAYRSTIARERVIRDAHGQIAVVNLLDFNVIGTEGSFRDDPHHQYFNPTNHTTPFFQVFDDEFIDVIGSNPSLNVISSDPSFAFAHEAPVWVPHSDEIFFASNAGGDLGRSDLNHNNQIAKISLKDVAQAMAEGPADVNVTHYKIDLPDDVQMTNGGTGLYKGKIILTNEGRGHLPANLALMDPHPPYNVSILLDNFYGRQFNSLNDVKVHSSGNIFFTDVPYGYYQHFKADPQLPNQVYSFNPGTGAIRVVADQLNKPNGIAFSKNHKTVYLADTGSLIAKFGINLTLPATIQEYDVDSKTLAFKNPRVFAYADSGAPDGLGVDEFGNVYGACFDGVNVWNPSGILIGKFFLGTKSANFAFAGKGRLVILAETKIYLAQINAKGMSLMYG
ncbi:D-lactonohydrolase-like protein [Lentinula raphanica]|uniref:D-lactonohydrolase-like protein n=1 Tax=Lentinula raphanica TaxID=153919 RepID=A0AA38UCC4_9AGAR|nr:calcium-dependent phosphotriesterase [Lentinula raphanica]KAJ3752927.1 D-lactonohydrolase-like protein [Lentinula raphanica]KAJ3766670.1 D-lactonohydrolase-like protein [Lentinula raphanica]KAJ3836761.1 D-lactonohydrolase-like protein [Lentinula raphanica]